MLPAKNVISNLLYIVCLFDNTSTLKKIGMRIHDRQDASLLPPSGTSQSISRETFKNLFFLSFLPSSLFGGGVGGVLLI